MNASSIKNFLLPGLSFILGALTIFIFLYLPSQTLIKKKEEIINKYMGMIQDEQERVQTLKKISTTELAKWVSLNQEVSGRFQEAMNRLKENENSADKIGFYMILLALFFFFCVFSFAIYCMRTDAIKAEATLENFQNVVHSYKVALQNQLPNKTQNDKIENQKDA